MSWTRKELKAKGHLAFMRNYWKCVLIALILSIISGCNACATPIGGGNSSVHEDQFEYRYEFSNAETKLPEEGLMASLSNDFDFPFSTFKTISLATVGALLAITFATAMFCLVIYALIGTFIFNPFHVGGCHFFLENSFVNTARFRLIIYGFKTNYKNNVLTMFLRSLYTYLWSLLFIIPGIIKSYEYFMVPYILADHPELKSNEVFELSKKMMNGQKWNTFVLQLSFIGWHLLNMITFGLLGLVYVNPYIHATNAELYLKLKQGSYK